MLALAIPPLIPHTPVIARAIAPRGLTELADSSPSSVVRSCACWPSILASNIPIGSVDLIGAVLLPLEHLSAPCLVNRTARPWLARPGWRVHARSSFQG